MSRPAACTAHESLRSVLVRGYISYSCMTEHENIHTEPQQAHILLQYEKHYETQNQTTNNEQPTDYKQPNAYVPIALCAMNVLWLENNRQFSIMKHVQLYKPGSEKYGLCLEEKLQII